MCNNLTKIKIKLTEMQQFLKFRIIVNKKMKLKSYSDLKNINYRQIAVISKQCKIIMNLSRFHKILLANRKINLIFKKGIHV